MCKLQIIWSKVFSPLQDVVHRQLTTRSFWPPMIYYAGVDSVLKAWGPAGGLRC